MAEKISLIGNKIIQLENIPKCPNLSTLLVSRNRVLQYIHNNFFLSMPALRLLDLSNTAVTKLPSSICELFELEFLNLSFTKIKSLPYQMRNLTKLKYLSLMSYSKCCNIPRGIIKNLSNLEFLELDVMKSEVTEDRFEIDELGSLKQLKYLKICIYSDSKDVEKFLSYPQFANCASSLSINACNDVTSLSLSAPSSSSLDLCLGHMKELRFLRIKSCSNMKDLKLNKEMMEFGGLFQSMERMSLISLPKLIISWDVRNLHCAHFINLQSVHLHRCNAMVDLTWLFLIPNLQTLHILACDHLQEILSSFSDKSGGACDQNTFSNLKFLILWTLPNLRSICSMSSLPFLSLVKISVIKCPKLRRLPLDSNSGNNTLKMIKGEEEWWDRLEWEDETIKSHFAKFYRRPL